MSAPALETRGLTVRFGHFSANADVDLTLAPGSRHAIIGPNGAGKTTFVHALTGGLAPAAGRVLLGGTDVTSWREARRVRHGLARTYQINQLFRSLTVLDNVALAIFERDGKTISFWSSARADARVREEAMACLDFVDLTHVAERPGTSWPYGSQRMLEIAIALATSPKVLVLDEPAAGVPAAASEAIFERIEALPSSLTLLFIEHDMNLVFRFAQRITVLVGGRVMAEGTPAEISADERVRAIYLGRRGHHASARD